LNSAIIILAAGSSSRLGKPKQLLEYRGKTLIQHAITSSENANIDKVIVVLGANHDLISKDIRVGERIKYVVNYAWHEGMSSSIKLGLTFLQKIFRPDCVILAVCDQPFINSSLLNDLIQTHIDSKKPIIACSYENTIGTPVLFDKTFFPVLIKLQGDHGAKKIIMQHPGEFVTIPFPPGDIDIDTKEQYDALIK